MLDFNKYKKIRDEYLYGKDNWKLTARQTEIENNNRRLNDGTFEKWVDNVLSQIVKYFESESENRFIFHIECEDNVVTLVPLYWLISDLDDSLETTTTVDLEEDDKDWVITQFKDADWFDLALLKELIDNTVDKLKFLGLNPELIDYREIECTYPTETL